MTLTIAHIEAALRRIDGVAVRTPLIEHPELNELAGGRVLVKPENLQRTGSFKIRGAYNLLSQVPETERGRGAVAWSSGNHAQGVALAGRLLGISTTIVMPEDAPPAKLDNTRRYGGSVVTYDRYSGDREAIALEIAERTGAIVVPSYDHPDIIAGQGTAGLEIADDARAGDIELTQALVCCGGGGLTAGSAIALRDRFPALRVHTVEPEGYDDTRRSLESGRRLAVDTLRPSICDALLSPSPGKLTFPILEREVESGLAVSEADVREAMRYARRRLRLVVEPGGAVALAAVLARKVETRGEVTAVMVSGGNVDVDLYAEIQAGPA
jgi:threonine dehydratase